MKSSARKFVVKNASVRVHDRKNRRARTFDKGQIVDLDALGYEKVEDIGENFFPGYLREATQEDFQKGMTPEAQDLHVVREELSRVERVAQDSQEHLDGLSDAELLETLKVARPDLAARLGDRLAKATREQLAEAFRPVTREEEEAEEGERLERQQHAAAAAPRVAVPPTAQPAPSAAQRAAAIGAQPPTNGGQSGGGPQPGS